ncbi:hypothetical protein KSS87_008779 [Heliosperma pusillum]|nr:hypothetical protein KSS87_008779 [Heliosperma pusillum]
MGYDDDPYRDEDGEPLMDYDDIQSDGEQPQPIPPNDDVQDFNDFNEDVDDDAENWGMQDDSPKSNPVESSKSRKRLIKKIGNDDNHTPSEFNDFADVDDVGDTAYDDIVAEKRKGKGAMTSDEGRGEKRKEKKKLSKDKFSTAGGGDGGSTGAKPKLSLKRRKGGGSGSGEAEPDPDVNEMWATIAGADSEVEASVAESMSLASISEVNEGVGFWGFCTIVAFVGMLLGRVHVRTNEVAIGFGLTSGLVSGSFPRVESTFVSLFAALVLGMRVKVVVNWAWLAVA